MRVALVGQPNSGKSSIFNAVAGYRTVVANFPGTTIEYPESRVRFQGRSIDLLELPGIYSLSSSEELEAQVRRRLLTLRPDVIVNVIDASVLCRSLELMLELLELGMPVVVALNMMDEARRKGMEINVAALSAMLGVPVVPLIARRGEGISSLFQVVLDTAVRRTAPRTFSYSRDVEAIIKAMEEQIVKASFSYDELPPRLLALRLLAGEVSVVEYARRAAPRVAEAAQRLAAELERSHGRPADIVLSSERHGLCLNMFEQIAAVHKSQAPRTPERLDRLLTHPWWGYVVIAAVLFSFFSFVFGFGQLAESILIPYLDGLNTWLLLHVPPGSLTAALLTGVLQGLSGGIGIVLPYLVPFFLGLALLEDSGYIPRVAFLMDNLMHRIGLHGKAIIPLVLGYGCSVPAVMSTRILENQRERYLAALLVNLIPCAARTTVLFAVVGARLGAAYALFLYALSIAVVGIAGSLSARFNRDASLGMILEIPSFRMPAVTALLRKIWFRLREFIVVAWPLLIAGSVALVLLQHLQLMGPFNRFLAPFTSGMLGLPEQVSWPLLMGILRKELTVIMLAEALGTNELSTVMTAEQMLVFTVFTLFYVPCLATLATLRTVIGALGTLIVLVLTTALATVLALTFRLALIVFHPLLFALLAPA